MIFIKINFNSYGDLNTYNWYQEPLKVQDDESPDDIPVLKKQSREGGSRYQKPDTQSRLGSPNPRSRYKTRRLPAQEQERREKGGACYPGTNHVLV